MQWSLQPAGQETNAERLEVLLFLEDGDRRSTDEFISTEISPSHPKHTQSD